MARPEDLLPAPISTLADLGAAALGGMAAAVERRADSWLNAMIGFGGSRDKTEHTCFDPRIKVLDHATLTAMFATESISRKIVDLYPREAMRAGVELGGFEGVEGTRDLDLETKVRDFLKPFAIPRQVQNAAIWGRLYGGCKIWFGSLDRAVDVRQPFVPGERVDFLRVIDRRFIDATTFSVDNLDVHGNPIMWRVSFIEGGPTVDIHTSRMAHFGGALTDAYTKRALAGWDLSVLQAPFNTLAGDGELWKSTRLLVSTASVGVIKIKGLWGMIAGKQKERLAERLQIQSMSRSIARDTVLDADGEDYTRVNTTFAGLPDLNDRSIQRIAADAEVPVALLGIQASGLNADGSSDLDWWYQRVDAYRVQEIEPAMHPIYVAVLSQEGSPVANQVDKLTFRWGALRVLSPEKQAMVYSTMASADGLYIDKQVLLPEEVALARFGDDGYSAETEIDRELRAEALEASKEHMLEDAVNPPEEVPPGGGGFPPGKGGPPPEDGEPAPRGDAYDPDQPRAPKGSGDGGRWTAAGAGAPVKEGSAKARARAKVALGRQASESPAAAESFRDRRRARLPLSREAKAKRRSGEHHQERHAAALARLEEAKNNVGATREIAEESLGVHAAERAAFHAELNKYKEAAAREPARAKEERARYEQELATVKKMRAASEKRAALHAKETGADPEALRASFLAHRAAEAAGSQLATLERDAAGSNEYLKGLAQKHLPGVHAQRAQNNEHAAAFRALDAKHQGAIISATDLADREEVVKTAIKDLKRVEKSGPSTAKLLAQMDDAIKAIDEHEAAGGKLKDRVYDKANGLSEQLNGRYSVDGILDDAGDGDPGLSPRFSEDLQLTSDAAQGAINARRSIARAERSLRVIEKDVARTAARIEKHKAGRGDAFDPDQPRDGAGQWVDAGGPSVAGMRLTKRQVLARKEEPRLRAAVAAHVATHTEANAVEALNPEHASVITPEAFARAAAAFRSLDEMWLAQRDNGEDVPVFEAKLEKAARLLYAFEEGGHENPTEKQGLRDLGRIHKLVQSSAIPWLAEYLPPLKP